MTTKQYFDTDRAAEHDDADSFSNRLAAIVDPSGPAAESYRALRTNLLYAFIDEPPRVILITSPGSKEGKSITCANLGVALAQAGKDTLILDCDLRRPAIHKFFGLHNFRGVVDVLVGDQSAQALWQEPLPGLKVLSVGPIPPNPAETLSSKRFAEFLDAMRERFDYVLIDSPPVGLVADPVILSTQGDGVLLVLDAQGTRKGTLRQSIRRLEAVGAKVIGTVMNNVATSKGTYGYYPSYTYS